MAASAMKLGMSGKLCLFTTCKPFVGESAILQRNALYSWQSLGLQVIVIGNEPGVAEAAAEFGAVNVPDVRRNEIGTPLVSDLFRVAKAHSKAEFLAYLNADIVLDARFLDGISAFLAAEASQKPFLFTARRRNVPLYDALERQPDWQAFLADIDTRHGSWDQANAIDIFMFRRELYTHIPDFAVGRMNWDNWLLWRARHEGAAVIDASQQFALYHPIHGYSGHAAGWKQVMFGDEAVKNRALTEGHSFDLDSATTHYLDASGRVVPADETQKARYCAYCLPDHSREFRAGLAYLAQVAPERSAEAMADYLKTLLWRNSIYFPMWHDREFEHADVEQLVGKAIDLLQGYGIQAAQNLIQDALCSRLTDTLCTRKGPLYLWGAGQAGRRALALLRRHGIAVSAFIDSNPAKAGSEVDAVPVVGPDVLSALGREDVTVLVASVFAPEIIPGVEAMGYMYGQQIIA